jgi:hypothetical protein
MSPPNPWEPKPLLDDCRWSLLPDLGLRRGAAWGLLAAWWGLLGLTAVLGVEPGARLVAAALLGTWALHYVGARLGGRPAWTGGAAEPIRPEAPFQARLAFDVIALLVLMTALTLLVYAACGGPFACLR